MVKDGIVATYCLYEPSYFFEESIKRIYGVVDHILLLVNTTSWSSGPDKGILDSAFKRIINLDDPEKKIVTIHRYWDSQHDQRNFGVWYTKRLECKWVLVIDDDELYNPQELQFVIDKLDYNKYSAYFIKQIIYWKSTDFVINRLSLGAPVFIDVDNVLFNDKRCIVVYKGKRWKTFDENYIVCHHMSYVRSDEQMYRKVRQISERSSSTEDSKVGWYNNKWLNWTLNAANLHPFNPESFPRAIPSEKSRFHLNIF